MGTLIKRIAAGWLFAIAAYAAGTPVDVGNAIDRLEQKVAKAPAGLGIEFRIRAAYALRRAWPDLSRELASRIVARLRTGAGWRITPSVMHALALIDPSGAMSVLPRMQTIYAENVLSGLVQLHRFEDARSVYLAALKRGGSATAALELFGQLSYDKSPALSKVYRDMLSAFSFDVLAPEDAFWIDSQLTEPVAKIDPAAAIEGTIRILEAASNPTYASGARANATGQFDIGSQSVTTNNSRDTVLLVAGARLFSLAPAQFEKRKALFASWGAAGPILVKSIRPPSPPSANTKTTMSTGRIPAPLVAVGRRLRELEDEAGIDDSAVIRIAAELSPLPPGDGKLAIARELADLALHRQASVPALTSAASVLLAAIRDSQPTQNPGRVATSFSQDYLTVATLIRYANVHLPSPGPALEAADALLALRERILEHAGFAVENMDGKPVTLSPVPGKVTLISRVTNVCARWKMQCDRPLPALDAFYREVEKGNVAVFAIAEEGRELFSESLDGEKFTVPVFADPVDYWEATFEPHNHESFLFDSKGKLALQVIGMRTQDQLREMVKIP